MKNTRPPPSICEDSGAVLAMGTRERGGESVGASPVGRARGLGQVVGSPRLCLAQGLQGGSLASTLGHAGRRPAFPSDERRLQGVRSQLGFLSRDRPLPLPLCGTSPGHSPTSGEKQEASGGGPWPEGVGSPFWSGILPPGSAPRWSPVSAPRSRSESRVLPCAPAVPSWDPRTASAPTPRSPNAPAPRSLRTTALGTGLPPVQFEEGASLP